MPRWARFQRQIWITSWVRIAVQHVTDRLPSRGWCDGTCNLLHTDSRFSYPCKDVNTPLQTQAHPYTYIKTDCFPRRGGTLRWMTLILGPLLLYMNHTVACHFFRLCDFTSLGKAYQSDSPSRLSVCSSTYAPSWLRASFEKSTYRAASFTTPSMQPNFPFTIFLTFYLRFLLTPSVVASLFNWIHLHVFVNGLASFLMDAVQHTMKELCLTNGRNQRE